MARDVLHMLALQLAGRRDGFHLRNGGGFAANIGTNVPKLVLQSMHRRLDGFHVLGIQRPCAVCTRQVGRQQSVMVLHGCQVAAAGAPTPRMGGGSPSTRSSVASRSSATCWLNALTTASKAPTGSAIVRSGKRARTQVVAGGARELAECCQNPRRSTVDRRNRSR